MAKKLAQRILIALMVATVFACAANQPITKQDPTEQATFYGFYSEKAAENGRAVLKYKTPDGKEMAVTYITPDPTGSGYLYPDKAAVGVVTEYMGTISQDKGQPQIRIIPFP